MSFIYVGRLDELKGIKVLFEAWKIMESEAPELIICGTGPLENWCKRYILSHGLRKIEMKGKLPNSEVKKLMSESQALILPTLWYEGFPMTIVEAYSVGCPVIGSDTGNVGCLIEEDVTGWKVDAGDSIGLSQRILHFGIFDRNRIKDIYKEKYTDNQNLLRLETIYSIVV